MTFSFKVVEGYGTPVIQTRIFIAEFSDNENILLHTDFALSSNLFCKCLFVVNADNPDNIVGNSIVTIMVFKHKNDICFLSLKAFPDVAHISSDHLANLVSTFADGESKILLVQSRPRCVNCGVFFSLHPPNDNPSNSFLGSFTTNTWITVFCQPNILYLYNLAALVVSA